jgi:hypothetical protein
MTAIEKQAAPRPQVPRSTHPMTFCFVRDFTKPVRRTAIECEHFIEQRCGAAKFLT